MSIIPRSNVIAGATDDSYRVGPSGDSDMGVLTKTVVLKAAALHEISTDPVELIEAPANGMAIQVVSIRVQKDAGAYSGKNVLSFRYRVDGPAYGQVRSAIVTSADATDAYADPAVPSSPVPPANTELVAAAAGNYSGDGGDVTVTIKYVLVMPDA